MPDTYEDFSFDVVAFNFVGSCRQCGNIIHMMCQQGTGFCSLNCHDDYAERLMLQKRMVEGMFPSAV